MNALHLYNMIGHTSITIVDDNARRTGPLSYASESCSQLPALRPYKSVPKIKSRRNKTNHFQLGKNRWNSVTEKKSCSKVSAKTVKLKCYPELIKRIPTRSSSLDLAPRKPVRSEDSLAKSISIIESMSLEVKRRNNNAYPLYQQRPKNNVKARNSI